MSPLDHLPALAAILLTAAVLACLSVAPVWLIVWSLALPLRAIGVAALLPLVLLLALAHHADGVSCRLAASCVLSSAAIVGLAAWVSA